MTRNEKAPAGQGKGQPTGIDQSQNSTRSMACPLSGVTRFHVLVLELDSGKWYCPRCDLQGGVEALCSLIRLEADEYELADIKDSFWPHSPLNVIAHEPALWRWGKDRKCAA